MNPSIEITIPILNEGSTLDQQVRKVLQYIHNNLKDLGTITIILADNGSTDATPNIAHALQQEFPDVQYLRLAQRGVGLALKASWGQSKADIVGYMDLDLATDLRYLRPALEKLLYKKSDIVTGSRLAEGALVIGRSFLRTFTSRSLNLILKIVFQISFSDGMCGFKFLKRSYLNDLQNAGAVSDGWFFATEILIAGEYLGYRISDLAVEWKDGPNSKVKISKLAVEYLNAMRMLRRRLPERRNPI